MNIGFINRMMGISRGGGENFDLNIARQFVSAGHSVHFFVGRKMFTVNSPLREFPVTYVKSPYLRWIMYWGEKKNSRIPLIIGEIARRIDLRLFERSAIQIIKQSKYDHINVYQLCALPDLAAHICKSIDKPTFVRWPGPPGKRLLIWKDKYSANIANGAAFKDVKRYDLCAHQINIGVDTDFFKPVDRYRNKSKNEIIILFVGRLIPVKNIPFLIQSFHIALKCLPELKLILVGDGNEKSKLQQMTKTLKIYDNVIFAGAQPTKCVLEYYNMADIFVLPSLYDNFPNVILEAMACELPIIATNVGGVSDQIKHNENGFIVKSNCIKEMVDALLLLGNQPDLRNMFGKKNRSEIVERYSWKKSALQLLNLYNEFLKKKRSSK
jgi:glycosyltransferase involved in cell wall biosynthesis